MSARDPKVLFVVNGMGLGNSTRCYAIIQELAKKNVRIFVATSGNGRIFFAGKPEVEKVIPLESMSYSFSKNGAVGLLKTIRSIPALLRGQMKNERLIQKIVAEIEPSTVVLDSQYMIFHRLGPGLPVIAINNSRQVVRSFYRHLTLRLSLHLHFLLFEFGDFVLHRFFVPVVLAPGFPGEAGPESSLLVRAGLKDSPVREGKPRVLVLFSGAASADRLPFDPREWNLPCEIDVAGVDGEDRGNVRFHGKVLANIDLLNQAHILVMNGGFSSLSEAIALKRPAVIVPIANHSEQYVNACRFQYLGFGLIASANTVESQLKRILEDYSRFRSAFERSKFDAKGAEKMGDFILQMAKPSSPT